MNTRFASTLGYLTVIAAIASASALTGTHAYAETPTIDTTPFYSLRSRDEVRAEVMAQRSTLANSEWRLQQQDMPRMSGYTRAQATADFLASREEARALTSEDSGSSYLAQRGSTQQLDLMMAGAAR